MLYIPASQRSRVQSLLTECEEHIRAALGLNVIASVIIRPAAVDEETIKDKVCEVFEVPWEHIYAHRRTSNTANARMAYSYLLSKFMRMSYPAIGKLMNRHHTTIIYEVRKAEGYLQVQDAQVAPKLTAIITYLNSINEPEISN